MAMLLAVCILCWNLLKYAFTVCMLSGNKLIKMSLERSTNNYAIFVIAMLLKTPMADAFQQLQLFQNASETDIFNSKFSSRIARFKVLELPEMYYLEECHWNEIEYYQFYEFWFNDICTKDDYYCINGNGYTLHICGSMPSCKRRYRNVVVYNITSPRNVDVYSVLCPDGYLQLSRGNCFNHCFKDDSVVVIRNSTTQKHALGYCNSEENKCNKKGFTLFEIASENDECSTEDSKCQQTGDLLPNCSCSPRCLPDQERSFNNNFTCETRHTQNIARPSIYTERTSHSTARPFIYTDRTSYSSSQTTDAITSGSYKVKTENNVSTIVIAVVALVAAAFVIVFLALMCFAYKAKLCYQTEYGGVPVVDRENKEPPVNGSAHTANGVIPEPVRKIENKKKVTNRTSINGRHIYINIENGIPAVDSEETDHMISDLSDEQRMDDLKPSPTERQPDSGMSSVEQTYVEKPY